MKRIEIDNNTKGFFIFALLMQLVFASGIYLFAGTATLMAMFWYLQQPCKPGVFSMIFLNHMLQILAAVWQTDFAGVPVNFRSPHAAIAYLLSIGGMLAMFLPILFYQTKLPNVTVESLREQTREYSTMRTFHFYVIALIFTSFLSSVAFAFSGLTQVILGLVKIKWFFFLLFGYQAILKKEHRNLFFIFVMIEFISGFVSYFSDFKMVIYFMAALAISITTKIKFNNLMKAMAFAMVLAGFGIIWQGVKGQYRSFLNGGGQSQTVEVSSTEALSKLAGLSGDVESSSLSNYMAQTLDRLQYVYHFSKTMDRVPSLLPHTNGKNWGDNLIFSTTPRFLYPDKPILEATEKTKKYTGLSYAGYNEGASFSLGYFAESYIDFGMWGMMLPLMALGFLYGKTYLYLMKRSSKNLVFNYAVVGSFFMEFYAFEMDGTFLLGRFFSSFLVYYMLIKIFFPWLIRYLSVQQQTIPLAYHLPAD